MRKLPFVLIMLAILISGALFYTALMQPAQRPAPDLKIEPTPERIARGKYLVEHVCACLECHSDQPRCFDEKLGFPGKVCVPNITPDREHGIGRWTDGEIIRAIREGVGKDGRALFPLMPYESYRFLSEDDVRAIVVYLKTRAPISEPSLPSDIEFPVSILIKFTPKPLVEPVPNPDPLDKKSYGRYLTQIGACEECHTPRDDHQTRITKKAFAGGAEFIIPNGSKVKSSNITASTHGATTREAFIGRFQSFANPEAAAIKETTVMPWLSYAGLTPEDLDAIYAFLETVHVE